MELRNGKMDTWENMVLIQTARGNALLDSAIIHSTSFPEFLSSIFKNL